MGVRQLDTVSGARDFTPTLTLPLREREFLFNCVTPVLIQVFISLAPTGLSAHGLPDVLQYATGIAYHVQAQSGVQDL